MKPASAIGPPLVEVRSKVNAVLEEGEILSIWFEYEAADCQVEVLATDVGHIPPKMYMSVSEALALTRVEKLNPLERKSALGMSADVKSLAVDVVSFVHIPLPVALVLSGVNLHSSALEEVEHDPAYTDISPAEDMEGMNAVELSLVNGRLDVIVSSDKFDWEIVEDILIEAN